MRVGGVRIDKAVVETFLEAISPAGLEAEIGPDKSRPQGALGNLLEFGSENNPPHNDGGRALQAEEPRFLEHLGKIVDVEL